ncbi:MAG TPA: multicopper oxidase domain-containing protein [Vicinamibacterales bacterium]|nr:multicopper oxidase domain-containing protein [Vicinamibacterales bacterium]
MRPMLIVGAAFATITAACATPQAANPSGDSPFVAPDLPALAGQVATCAGPKEKSFTLDAREVTVDLGMGMRLDAWVYNGKLPGPTLEACEGDRVTITVANHAETWHGLDSHALRTDMMHFGPVAPNGSMRIEKTVDTPGAFMYHCAAGAVTDQHIKSGLYGAMIVYPRSRPLRAARELVVVQGALYGEADASGHIPGADPARVQKNDPTMVMFNGRLEHTALKVRPGDLVRAYVVNVGPGVSAIHVMGTILDTVYDGASEFRSVQSYGVTPGGGAIVEFRIPEAGMYGLVDHNRLSYLPYGMEIVFDASESRPEDQS